MKYQVAVCESPSHAMLRVARAIRPDRMGEDIAAGMRALVEVAYSAGLTANGAPTITFYDPPADGRTAVVDFGLPVEPAPNLGPSYGAELMIADSSLVARTCHLGDYSGLEDAYRAISNWLHTNGFRAIGPATEVYLVGPEDVNDPRQLITEIRIPVAPDLAMSVHLDVPFADAVSMTREALGQAGFGVITEIDMRATLRDRLNEGIEDYLVLGACNPRLSYDALMADRQVGLLLPCNVVVRSSESGTLVEAIDPDVVVRSIRQDALRPVAAEVRKRLREALDALRRTAPVAEHFVTAPRQAGTR